MNEEKNQERAYALIASYRADGDRYRDRARSVATLLATLSGALAAGLIFSPVGQGFPEATKYAGYAAILALGISVCFFLSGSMYRLPNQKPDEKAEDPKPSLRDLVDASERNATSVVDAITLRTRLGSGFGIAALLLLMAMGPIAAIYPTPPVPISVQPLESLAVPTCPNIQGNFDGTASASDLAGTAALIPVSVSREVCGHPSPSGSLTIYLQRTKILITTARG
ncbi:hypothetical protein [Paenarthrobacter sp. AMU7]|uniref:Uncharacterized protein n=1 Tax=Paenarthrobacter sp. AMU7 TaxID=3162492 RepID=A0AB39YLR9_9MICC